jgi:putative transposase
VVAVDRSSARYAGRRPDDAELHARLRAVAMERRRFGYRLIHVMLAPQGMALNLKKLRRLYADERLQMKRRGGGKRALGTRQPIALPTAPSTRWSLDFGCDAFTDGRRFRILAVVDDLTRECPALVADISISGVRIARELDVIIVARGRSRSCVSDNGSELTGIATLGLAPGEFGRMARTRLASRNRTPSQRASSAGCLTNY